MKINEITDSAQNVKAESGMKELQSVAATISDPENWAISMTGEPKLGINPQVGISEDTPKGIYFYPLDYAVDSARRGKKLPWGDNMPYIQLFQYDRSGEMTKKTKVDPARLKQALLQYCPEEVIQQAAEENEYDGTPYWFIYDCLSRLGKGDETNVVRWNKVLRDLGFTSVYDDGAGWIAHNEPTQGVVLDPRIIKQHKTISNKKQSGVVTPAVIERDIFNTLDIELASDRAWQAYDPDGSKLKAAAKELAKRPVFKQWFGKPGSEEIFDKAASLGRYGAVQLRREAWDWDKEQQTQEGVAEELEEGWKDWVAGGAMALGAMGAQASDIVSQVVNPGDTVYSIARQNNVAPAVLFKLNGFNNNTKLTPGQEVKVPDVYTKDAKPVSKSAIAKGIKGAAARGGNVAKPVVKAEPKAAPVVKRKGVIDVKPVTDNPLEKVVLAIAIKSGIIGTELAAFMSQVAHESHDFKSMVEYGGSLDFRKYDPKYAPKKAKSLGNKYAGDGNKFKGRGFIQITGRYNYRIAGKAIGIDLVKNPKLAEDPAIAAKIAVWYWKLRVQPNVDNWNNVTDVTRPINPGMRGLQDRKENFNDYMELAQADATADKKEV